MAHRSYSKGGATGAKDNNDGGNLRLFVAIELPEFVKEAIAGLQSDIKNETGKSGFPAKWTAVQNIHLTLKFLGDTPVSQIDAIGSALADASAGFFPVSLCAMGLSVFPGPRRPRVLWTGVGGRTDRLATLQKKVEDNLGAAGFERENRMFKAHLTIARFKGRVDPQRAVFVMTKYGDFATGLFDAGQICLFKSRLTPHGPVYTRLQAHRLDGCVE